MTRRVTIQDVRDAGHCVAGARRWFEAHGMDFRAFIAEGIPEDEFLERGDGLAAGVVEHKRRAAGGGS